MDEAGGKPGATVGEKRAFIGIDVIVGAWCDCCGCGAPLLLLL